MTQVSQNLAPQPEPVTVSPQKLTTQQLTDAVSSIPDGSTPQDALTAFAAALGIPVPPSDSEIRKGLADLVDNANKFAAFVKGNADALTAQLDAGTVITVPAISDQFSDFGAQ